MAGARGGAEGDSSSIEERKTPVGENLTIASGMELKEIF